MLERPHARRMCPVCREALIRRLRKQWYDEEEDWLADLAEN